MTHVDAFVMNSWHTELKISPSKRKK